MDGVQTYRNPGLVNILNKLHYIENFGTGIPRIMEAYANSNKKPVFDPSGNFFILTLPNLNYIDAINDQVKVGLIKDDKLGDVEIALLRIISLNPGLNAVKLLNKAKQNYSDVTIDTIRNVIKRKLVDYIEFKGAPKTGGYYIKSK